MLEEPAAENLHGGIREGGDRLESWPTYTRTKLETAERRQGTPKTQGGLLYSDCAGLPRIIKGRPFAVDFECEAKHYRREHPYGH
jgi:hypothetical protein